MRALVDAVAEGRFVHDGGPALEWQFANTVGYRDKKDNIYPRKEHENHKIDAVVAIVMALSRFEQRGPTTTSDSPFFVL